MNFRGKVGAQTGDAEALTDLKGQQHIAAHTYQSYSAGHNVSDPDPSSVMFFFFNSNYNLYKKVKNHQVFPVMHHCNSSILQLI